MPLHPRRILDGVDGARTTVAQMLAEARDRIRRYMPEEVAAGDLVIVDTRDSSDRLAHGVIPDSIWVPRTTLEWRADPTAELPDPRITGARHPIVVVCNDGYSSSLAAANLVELGYHDAGDLAGGFRAWSEAGLPVVPSG